MTFFLASWTVLMDFVRYLVPIQMNAIPTSRMTRSRILALRLRSLKKMTAHANEMITELRRTKDTTEISESGSLKEV